MIKNELSEEQFNIFSKYIEGKSGIYLDLSKKSSLQISLILRMEKKRLKDYEKYYKYLVYSPHASEEFKELLNLVTINETQFYRYPAQFHALNNEVLPTILKNKAAVGDRKLKIWSAGCSSGEEAYSIAMLLREAITDLNYYDIEIFATDISKNVLAVAEAGIYAPRTLRLLNSQQISDNFRKLSEKKFKVNGNIRRMVKFSYLNLAEPLASLFAGGGFDIVFCRNVLIYFKPATVKVMLDNFYRCLNDGGYLFVGHSESLFHLNERFNPIAFRNAFIYKKEGRIANDSRTSNFELRTSKKNIFVPTLSPSRARQNRPIESKLEALSSKLDLYTQATDYFMKADLKKCQELVDNILKDNPNMAKAIILQARIFMEKGDLAKAKPLLEKTKKIDPLLFDSYFFLASIYSLENEVDMAIKELKGVLFINKDFAIAHYNLANLYRTCGQLKDAAREYANAIDNLNICQDDDLAFYSGGFSADLLLESAKSSLKMCSGNL